MNTITSRPSAQAEQRAFKRVNEFVLAWFALIAAILIGMSFVPALRSASVVQEAPPARRYTYCSKAWQQQLPTNMQATFEDWCEHRPGAINPTGR